MSHLSEKIRTSGNRLAGLLREQNSFFGEDSESLENAETISKKMTAMIKETVADLLPQIVEELNGAVEGHMRSIKMEMRGPKGEQGPPGLDGETKTTKEEVELTAEEVKNKLSSLRGNDRLDASAIKNLPSGGRKGLLRGGGAAVRGPEIPTGTINGSNVTFTLLEAPKTSSVMLFVNGAFQREGSGQDFTISGRTITMATAPPTGSNIICVYRV